MVAHVANGGCGYYNTHDASIHMYYSNVNMHVYIQVRVHILVVRMSKVSQLEKKWYIHIVLRVG